MEPEDESERTPRDPRRDEHGRFRRGFSGNPDGPKRGVPSFLVCLRSELSKATASGQTRLEELCAALVDRAIAGDPASMQLVLKRIAPESLSVELVARKFMDKPNPETHDLREWLNPVVLPEAPESTNRLWRMVSRLSTADQIELLEQLAAGDDDDDEGEEDDEGDDPEHEEQGEPEAAPVVQREQHTGAGGWREVVDVSPPIRSQSAPVETAIAPTSAQPIATPNGDAAPARTTLSIVAPPATGPAVGVPSATPMAGLFIRRPASEQEPEADADEERIEFDD